MQLVIFLKKKNSNLKIFFSGEGGEGCNSKRFFLQRIQI